jgi:hypothetical protein
MFVSFFYLARLYIFIIKFLWVIIVYYDEINIYQISMQINNKIIKI